MKLLGCLVLSLVGFGIGYAIGKGKAKTPSEVSGIGAGGSPRFGRPKTEEERLATHRALYGEETLPPRGTGLKRRGIV